MNRRSTTWRVAAGLVAILFVPLVVWIDLALATRRGWEAAGPMRPVLRGLSLALLAGVAALLVRSVRSFLERSVASIALVATSLVVGLILADLLAAQLRILPVEDVFHLRSPGYHMVFRPMPEVMPGIEGDSHVRINSNGIRGDELPTAGSAYRILCVGGSTTECLYLDQSEAWPQLLQGRLSNAFPDRRIWVGNVGISGYGTPHHLSFLRASNLVPEMDCLVFLVGVNDFMLFLRGFDFDFSWTPRSHPHPELFDTSLGKLVTAFHQRRLMPELPDRIAVEDEVGGSYVARRKKRGRASRTPLPDLDDALAGFRSRLVDMAGFCHGDNIRCVFVSQPVLWKKDMTPEEKSMLWLGFTQARGPSPYVDEVELREGIDRYNDVLVSVCRDLDVELVDLGEMSGNGAFFYDDCHFNEAGAAEVAARLAEHFRKSGL